MSKNKKYQLKSKVEIAEEPTIAYEMIPINIFISFEEEDEYVAKERSKIPCDKRMIYVEELRKRVFNNYIIAKWQLGIH